MSAVNGAYVGERIGTPLLDTLAPDDDGYDYLRQTVHIGTPLSDALSGEYESELCGDTICGKTICGKKGVSE